MKKVFTTLMTLVMSIILGCSITTAVKAESSSAEDEQLPAIWSCNDTEIAVIDARTGIITGKKVGTVTISANEAKELIICLFSESIVAIAIIVAIIIVKVARKR